MKIGSKLIIGSQQLLLQSFAVSVAQVNGLYFSTNGPFWLFPIADSDPKWDFHTYIQLVLIILKGGFVPDSSHPTLLSSALFNCLIPHWSVSIFNPHVTATCMTLTLFRKAKSSSHFTLNRIYCVRV